MSIHVDSVVRVSRHDHAYTMTLRDVWSKSHGFSIYSWSDTEDTMIWSWDEYKLALRPLYAIEYKGLISDCVSITLESGTKLYTSADQLILRSNKEWIPACKLSGYVLGQRSWTDKGSRQKHLVHADRVLSVLPCTAFDAVELTVMETRTAVVNGVIVWA